MEENEERQKKIETGKLKLAKFRKKKHEKSKTSNDSKIIGSFESSSLKTFDEKYETTDSSSTTSINTMKEKSEISLKEVAMDSSPIAESAFATAEDTSDDGDQFLDVKQTALVSCMEQKLFKYQEAIKQKDSIIQQLSEQLSSALSSNETANLEGSELIEKLRSEISVLQLQMKKAAGMIQKGNSKSNDKENIQVFPADQVPIACEASVQVELLSVDNLHGNQSIAELFEKQTNYPSDVISISKKIDSLNVIAKLIESLVNISSKSINESNDFSPSKFQSFFLRRMNSGESDTTQVEESENESQLSSINYAEIGGSTVRNSTDFPPKERMRCSMVPKDLSLITDYLLSEMKNINFSLHSLRSGPQGDSNHFILADSKGPINCVERTTFNENSITDMEEILQQKTELEAKLIQLKQLDKELVDARPKVKPVESNFSSSDDILIMEEPPLSCVSLLSLTDSEFRADCITIDSEANFSRKVSLDSSKPAQDTDFCPKCDKFFELAKEKYDDHICLLKETIETNVNLEKNEAVKKLELEIDKMKTEKESLHSQMMKQIELLCQEQELKIQHLINEHQLQLTQLQEYQSKRTIEKEELVQKIRSLETLLSETKDELRYARDEKASIEYTLQKQITDLVEEHQEDLEARQLAISEQITQERKKLETEHSSSLTVLKKLHEDELEDLKKFHSKELKDREMCLKKEHSEVISQMEAVHLDEVATYQKKVEQLLEEKCELLSKTTQEYEAILEKNHKALVKLCNQLRKKLLSQKKKVINESCQSTNGDLDVSITDAFDELSKNIENGIVRFLDQSYFSCNENQEIGDSDYIQSDSNPPIPDENCKNLEAKIPEEKIERTCLEKDNLPEVLLPDGSLEPEDIQMIHAETLKLLEEFQKDIAVYIEVNEQLRSELLNLQTKNKEMEGLNKKLESQLLEKEKELTEKESQFTPMDNGSVKGCLAGSQLTSSDFRSWQVDVAQTNSRLLHVLSDLVKTFLDIEQDINRHLYEHGLIPPRSGALGHQDDETGHSVGSREDFASLSFGECPNLELAEDGPDLTPRAWDLFSAAGTYDHEMEGEDVVLGASRRLRLAVDHVLNLLTRALDNQQNQDLKLLMKRNEELSQELQDESKGRDDVLMQLVTAESTIRKLENEKQRLEDTINDLRENLDILKREVTMERNRVTFLTQDKEAANDEIQTLKNQCEVLASRLGDPERKLLQENSRLSSEKHNVQINLSKERQSFLDRLQQMEMALEDLNAEKDELMETKCKEIRDLKAEMEAMEKQLQSNKRFIEEQAQEREQEREDYLKELNKMQEIVREKEKIQSNEAQLVKEIESLEQVLRARIEDHQNAMQKKDLVENELRQSLDKIRDLRDIIEELEKQLNIKTRVESELRHKLSVLTEAVSAQERRNSLLDDEIASSKSINISGDSTEQVENLKEKLASQSQEIEEMSQNNTLLHELRGQIHFLEAKVEQRAKQLETIYLTNSPVQSADTSPSSSQESESLHLPCEDSWEMSPRSIHWLEVQRLEEKIGRLVHIDEELIKRNKELEQKLKRLQSIHSECELENTALQEKLSEQLIQVSALKSHIDEQKHRPATPQKSQALNKRLEELQDAYETMLENNKQLLSELQETRYNFDVIKEEMKKKDYLIESLQRSSHLALKQKEEMEFEEKNDASDCYKLLLIEKEEQLNAKSEMIKNLEEKLMALQEKITNIPATQGVEMDEKNMIIDGLNKEKAEMKSEVDVLRNEIASLKELLESSKKQLESKQDQVEALVEELNTLSVENRRLEQDLDTVQNMMQQKEQELETLHEETDAQMKVEAELESLERELERQKSIESDLRLIIQKLETALDTTSSVMKQDNEEWKLRLKDLEKSHTLEVEILKKQLDILKRNLCENGPEDIDLAATRNEILEAAKIFNLKESQDDREYADLVYSILKKAVNKKLHLIQKEHEAGISYINDSWQQKIEGELETRSNLESCCEKYKKDYLLLQEKMKEETDKLCSERDFYWQSKLDEIQNSIKETLNESHSKELNFLQSSLEQLSKEKTLVELEAKNLAQQVEQLSKKLQSQKEKVLQELQAKIALIEQNSKEHHDLELKLVKENLSERIESLQLELERALKREKETNDKHEKEISELHKLFEVRWSSEMKKIVVLQMKELEKLNNSKEKNLSAVCNQLFSDYSEKLKKLQHECALQMTEERKQSDLRHQAELHELNKKFQDEKRSILITKEREMSALAEALENEKKELRELKSSIQSKYHQYDWEEEKLKLIKLHEKELAELRHTLQTKYERLLQNQLQARDSDMRSMEETYNQRLEEVSDLLKIAKRTATGSMHSDSGSNRTTTPSSEVTSSDEACSSCQEDMLAGNRHILVDKLHQDGRRILNLLESSGLTTAAEKEAVKWLVERAWIIEKLKTLNKGLTDRAADLKPVINNLCDEVLDARKRINDFSQEIISLKKKCVEFEEEINENNSKMYILASNLNHQRMHNDELEKQLTSKNNETADLIRTLEENRSSALEMMQSRSQLFTTNSPSCESDRLRSADLPMSSDKFSMFLPEVGSSPPVKLNKTEEMYPEGVKTLLELTDEILRSPEEIVPPIDELRSPKSLGSSINQQLASFLNVPENSYTTLFEAKVHGLYWVYRKSLSFNKSLIYQKKYLLMLLKGFQATEKITLTCVNEMNKNIMCDSDSNNSSSTWDCPLRGRKFFRSVAIAIIAIQRMKYYVKRWSLFAKVPSSDIVNAEVLSVFHNYKPTSPSLTPYGFNSSFQSLSSKSASVHENDFFQVGFNSSASSVSSRIGSISKRKSTSDRTQLIEYVQRLDTLQKHLGLDSLR